MTDPATTVSALADRQHGFAAAVRDLGHPVPVGVESCIVPGGTLDATAAIAVYRDGYRARLSEQLGETYATVWRAVGDDGFLLACHEYIASHPSPSYNLSDYGRDFPAWLQASPLSSTHPFVVELAAFELAFHDLFHAEAHVAADVSQAAAVAARGNLGAVRLRFGHAMRLVALERAVYDLFRHRDAQAAPDVDVERRQWMLLFRQGGDVRALELDEGTFAALESMTNGATVAQALAFAQRKDPAFGETEASALFGLLVSCGIVTQWID